MADVDLQNAFNLMTLFAVDNKAILLNFFVGVGVVIFCIIVARMALGYTVNKVSTAIDPSAGFRARWRSRLDYEHKKYNV